MSFIYNSLARKGLKKSRERHQNLSEEEKNKKLEYCYKLYKNLSKNEKQKLVEYRYYEMQKNENLL